MKKSKIYYFIFALSLFSCSKLDEIDRNNYKNMEAESSAMGAAQSQQWPSWLNENDKRILNKESNFSITDDVLVLSKIRNGKTHPFLEKYKKRINQILKVIFSLKTIDGALYIFQIISQVEEGNIVFFSQEDRDEFIRLANIFRNVFLKKKDSNEIDTFPYKKIDRKTIDSFYLNSEYAISNFLNKNQITKDMYLALNSKEGKILLDLAKKIIWIDPSIIGFKDNEANIPGALTLIKDYISKKDLLINSIKEFLSAYEATKNNNKIITPEFITAAKDLKSHLSDPNLRFDGPTSRKKEPLNRSLDKIIETIEANSNPVNPEVSSPRALTHKRSYNSSLFKQKAKKAKLADSGSSSPSSNDTKIIEIDFTDPEKTAAFLNSLKSNQ